MGGWTIEWIGRGWDGPKAWTLRVGLMIQGLKSEAEDWGFKVITGRRGETEVIN